MITNTAITDAISRTDQKWFVKVLDLSLQTRAYVRGMQISVTGRLPAFECHTICRAIAMHLRQLKVVDGYYFGVKLRASKGKMTARFNQCTHSWLTTPSGTIIDPYPVGFLSVNAVLVVNRGKYKDFGGNLYWPDRRISKKVSAMKLGRKVRILAGIIGKAKTRLA